MENINNTLATNIQRLRKDAGMTQEELAGILGITFQAVSKWENEKSTPDISLLPLIADTFKCSLDELFSRETPQTGSDEKKDDCKDEVTKFFPELGEMLSEAAKKAEADKASKNGFADLIDWGDDGVIRGVVFEGRKIVKTQELLEKFTFEIEGDAKKVSCGCNLSVSGYVSGGCNAGRDVAIGGGLSGGCNAGRGITVGGNLSGGCNCGREITVGQSLTGNVNAREVTAKNIKAEKIWGCVSCESLDCDCIKGTVTIVRKDNTTQTS